MGPSLRLVIGVCAWGAGTASAATDATDFTDRWLVGARAGIVVTDQAFRRDGDTWLFAFGRTLGPQYAVEVEAFRERLDFGIGYGLRHRGVALNVLTINREPLWDPYFLVGLGTMRFEAPPGQPVRRGSVAIAHAAIGGQWELLLPERLLLRAELRMRVSNDRTGQPGQEGYGDGTFTVGLTIPF
jgi:hypothetical protein